MKKTPKLFIKTEKPRACAHGWALKIFAKVANEPGRSKQTFGGICVPSHSLCDYFIKRKFFALKAKAFL
jgi:hypothetical protein